MSDITFFTTLFIDYVDVTFCFKSNDHMISRYQETRADRYAIEMTKDSEAGITTFQELTRAGLESSESTSFW